MRSFDLSVVVDGQDHVGRVSTDGHWVHVEYAGLRKDEPLGGLSPEVFGEILLVELVRSAANRPES